MLRLILAWAIMVAGMTALPAPAAAQGRPQQLQCSSYQFGPARCPIYIGRAGFVKAVQITNQPCDQGRTWGWDANGIWVTGNCRAVFAVFAANSGGGGGYPGNGGYPGGGGGFPPQARQIACESWQFRAVTCPAETRGGVRLLQQTGGICTQGQTWGFTPRGIWVNNGCRAIFAVVGGRPYFGPGPGIPDAPIPGGGGRFIACESWQFQPQRCAVDVYQRPQIEVIAGNCVQGQTWGWDRGGIWVNGGCRARFRFG